MIILGMGKHPPITLTNTHSTLSAEKITAWCKRFYVEDYGRRKKKWLGQGLNPLPLAW